jgi:predicted AlkP superfamily pyrophosphatase or phosphodiesterase
MIRALALLLVVLATSARAAEPTVILLSWDGTRFDYPDREELPGLSRIARDGVRAERLIPVFPTTTFPNHVTLATGAPVDRHGIVANEFTDRARGEYRYSNDASWIEAEPLWAAAERQGVRAACFFWVGSETDWRGVGATHRRAPFDSSIGEAEKVDQILAWLALPEAQRPRLVMSWWHGADRAGHEYGPDSDEVAAALALQDGHLARLLGELDARGAWSHTTLLVVSDHGMSEVRDSVDALGALAAAGIGVARASGSTVAHVALDDAAQRDEALAALARVAGLRAWASDAVPEALRARFPSRTGDLVLVADRGLAFASASRMEVGYFWLRALFGGRRGAHGYLPDEPEMAGVFLAMGRGVPADLELGPVRALDVAATVAHLLGIAPPAQSEGARIPGIGD